MTGNPTQPHATPRGGPKPRDCHPSASPPPAPTIPRACRAFSLIELLVVISIIALLVGILLPVLGAVRGTARATVCMSNQRQTTTALHTYTHDHRGQFVPNMQRLTAPNRALWWFGLEAGGPGSPTAMHRPMDTTKSPLAPYFGGDLVAQLHCPDFAHNDPRFFPKFVQSSAHFGYNESLAPLAYKKLPSKRLADARQPTRVFAFADAVHIDGLNKINGQNAFYEPHYVQHNKIPAWFTGFGHFRHRGNANTAMLDGHVTARPQTQPTFDTPAGAPAANLDDTWGADSIYGFETGI